MNQNTGLLKNIVAHRNSMVIKMGDNEAEVEQIKAILADDAKLSEVTKAVFDAVDEDHSGQIDKKELKKAMHQVSQEAGIAPPSEEQVNCALHTLDTDGSGTIDVHEFKELIRQLLESIKGL